MRKINLTFATDTNVCPLTEDEVSFFRTFLDRTLKVSVEPEWNLQEGNTGNCKGTALICPCANIHEVDNINCNERCLDKGKCELEKKGEECPRLFCAQFKAPCTSCKKYIKDCNKCDYRWDPSKDPQGVRDLLAEELIPTQNYGVYGKHCIMSVKKDNSLLGKGGVEIPTIGRRVDYYEFLDMTRFLYNKVINYGGYVNERSGLHYHMLVDYNRSISSVEKGIPGIFMRNLHQLFRIYQNALVWISSAGESNDHLTRWEKFRESIIGISGVINTAHGIQEKTNRAYKEKYSLISYRDCSIHPKTDEIDRFHIEARYPDGLNSPTAVAALAMLPYTFAMKAIDLSMHGILQQPAGFFKKQKDLSSKLLNNRADYESNPERFSDTSKIGEKERKFLIESSLEMISLMRPYLKRWPEAANVLNSLAERPCSIRLIEGAKWEWIEKELSAVGNKQYKISGEEVEILKAVDLYIVSESTEESWQERVAEEFGKSVKTVAYLVNKLKSRGKIEWSPVEGSFTRI